MKKRKSVSVIAALMAGAIIIVSACGCSNDKDKNNTTDPDSGIGTSEETTMPSSENTTAGSFDESNAPSGVNETTGTEGESTTDKNGESEVSTTKQTTDTNNTTQETTKMNEEKTTANSNSGNENSNQPKPPVTVPDKTEFDIITGDVFYIIGKSVEPNGATEPLEIARTNQSLYFLSQLDGIKMGALMRDGTAYMICDEKKVYLEMSDSIKKLAGMDDSDMMDVSTYSFSDLKALKNADSITENKDFYGTNATEYTFRRDSSMISFYLSGAKLLGFTTADIDGANPSTTVITSITSNVPQSKTTPPSDYKRYKGIVGAIKFMTAVGIEG